MLFVFVLALVQPVDAHVGSILVAAFVRAASGLNGMVGSNHTAAAGVAPAQPEMTYTDNSFCRRNYCVNPIFPGLNDLPNLETLQWQCSTNSMVHSYMDFCKSAVFYDPSLPSPKSKATPVDEIVKSQEDAAMTMFFMHLQGMGFESWDYQDPSQSDNDCVRSIWKMVCYSYFPRAEPGCQSGQQAVYKRPCKSCCQNYIKHCGVECCDESVSCVFAHTRFDSQGQLQLLQTGYVDADGPSAKCTGGTRRSLSSPWLLLLGIFGFHWATAATSEAENHKYVERVRTRCVMLLDASRFGMICLMVLMSLLLQSCDIPHHKVGNWRQTPSYLNEFSFVPPGKSSSKAVLNSCSVSGISASNQCSGKGYCKAFSKNSLAAQQQTLLAFCFCERDWAGPECSEKRKSQVKTFFISLLTGLFGGDYFYLGFPLWGAAKCVSLGGLGFWWLIDVVRTASGPVYAYDYRTAADLPHWVANIIVIFLFSLAGFAIAIVSYLMHRRGKRLNIANFSNREENRRWKRTPEDMSQFDGPHYRNFINPPGAQVFEGRPAWSGYGSTMPLPLPNAEVPYATPSANGSRPPFAGPFGPSGVPGEGSPAHAAIGVVAPTNMNLGLRGKLPPMDDDDFDIPRVA